MSAIVWLLSIILAFSLGVGVRNDSGSATDEELKDRVQEHIDVIVDESAAIVDEVTEELRKDERVQEAEQFVQDVRDVATETADEFQQLVEHTQERIEERFGTGDAEATEEPGTTDQTEVKEEKPETPAEENPTEPPAGESPAETPAPAEGEPVNG